VKSADQFVLICGKVKSNQKASAGNSITLSAPI
jgi:hypothetical protein